MAREEIPEEEASRRVEWMMLRAIDQRLRDFETIFRGDGSDDNPGLVVKVDRLSRESEQRQKRADRHETWLWTLSSGIVLTAIAWLMGFLPQPPR